VFRIEETLNIDNKVFLLFGYIHWFQSSEYGLEFRFVTKSDLFIDLLVRFVINERSNIYIKY